MDWQAVTLSFKLALVTTLILLIIGLPFSYWLSTCRSRLKFILEAAVALPLVLPPSVLGFYVLIAISPQSPVGQFYSELTGGLLPFSFEGLLIGSVLYSLPFAVQPFLAGFTTLDRQLVEASWCLGESKLGTFFRIILPLCLPSILTGIVLSFAHTLGEFGVVLMIGGDIPGVTRTLSVSIFDQVQALDYVSAGKTSVFLLCLSFMILVSVGLIRKRAIQVWQPNSR
jgi:molybdate transport system permease protein